MLKNLWAPFRSKTFVLLALINIFFQFEATETFFNKLTQNTKTEVSGAVAQHPICGSSAFWAAAPTSKASISAISIPLAPSSLNGKYKAFAAIPDALTYSIIIAQHSTFFVLDNCRESSPQSPCGLSPPSKT